MQKLGKDKLCIQLCLLLRFRSYIFLQNQNCWEKCMFMICTRWSPIYVFSGLFFWPLTVIGKFYGSMSNILNLPWKIADILCWLEERSAFHIAYLIYRFLSNLKFLLEVIIHLVFFFNIISFHDLNKWEYEECLTVSIFQIWKKYFHWLWIKNSFYFDKKIETRNFKFIFLLSTSLYSRNVQLVKNRLV